MTRFVPSSVPAVAWWWGAAFVGLVATTAAQPPAPISGRASGDPLRAALDTDGDGRLSAAEVAGASRTLAALDTDRDGRLSAVEVGPVGDVAGPPPVMREPFGGRDAPAPDPAETLTAVMAFDADGDGRLTALELPARFQGIRNRADPGRRGFATREELLAALQSRGADGGGREGSRGFRGPDPGMVVDMILRFDADGDGRLSREELTAAAAVLVGTGGPAPEGSGPRPPEDRRAPQ